MFKPNGRGEDQMNQTAKSNFFSASRHQSYTSQIKSRQKSNQNKMYSTSSKFIRPTSDPDISVHASNKHSTFNGRISPAGDYPIMSHELSENVKR